MKGTSTLETPSTRFAKVSNPIRTSRPRDARKGRNIHQKETQHKKEHKLTKVKSTFETPLYDEMGNFSIVDGELEFDPESFSYKQSQTYMGTDRIKTEDDDILLETEKRMLSDPNLPALKFPERNLKTRPDDELKSRCHDEGTRQLISFSLSSNKDNTGEEYINLCRYNLENGGCIAPAEDQTDYQIKSKTWKSVNGNSTGLYKWAGRFFNPSDDSDYIAFSENQAAKMHEFSVYANCGPYHYVTGFLKVMTGSFTDIKVDTPDERHLWADIHATRQCLNEPAGKLQTRSFVLKFDPSKFVYGPPNDDPDLVQPCTDKEMSLPFDLETE
jgi:hypothetical protein